MLFLLWHTATPFYFIGFQSKKSTKNSIAIKATKSYMYIAEIFPAAMGAGVLQINLLVMLLLASLVGSSAVSYLYYSDRIAQLPWGLLVLLSVLHSYQVYQN